MDHKVFEILTRVLEGRISASDTALRGSPTGGSPPIQGRRCASIDGVDIR